MQFLFHTKFYWSYLLRYPALAESSVAEQYVTHTHVEKKVENNRFITSKRPDKNLDQKFNYFQTP